MDLLLLIAAIVISLLLLAVSFYLLVVYVHTDDKGWGTAWYCKILVIVAMILAWGQALMLPMDVANSFLKVQDQLDMTILWQIVYFVTLGMVVVLMPLGIYLYETDPNKNWLKRILSAAVWEIVTVLVVAAIVFISWKYIGEVQIDIQVIKVETAAQTIETKTVAFQSTLFVYLSAIMSLCGWILLILFGGVGLFSLPLDMIEQFRRRPRPRRSQQVHDTKDALSRAVKQLNQTGQQLKNKYRMISRNDQEGFFKKIKDKTVMSTQFNSFKSRYLLISEEFEIFRLELSYLQSNPFQSLLNLILGIVFLLTSLIWIFQIAFGILIKDSNGQTFFPTISNLMLLLQESPVAFLAPFIYGYLSLYLLACILKGNLKFGIRIPFLFKFHPMRVNATWMNSFLVNMLMVLLASCAITQLSSNVFEVYASRGSIYQVFGLQLNNMTFYRYVYQKNIVYYVLLGWSAIVLVYLLVRCNRPPKHIQEIEKIRRRDPDTYVKPVQEDREDRVSQED